MKPRASHDGNFETPGTLAVHCDEADAAMRAAMAKFYGQREAAQALRKKPKMLKPRSPAHPVLADAAYLAETTVSELIGARRYANISRARFALMVVFSREGWSLPRIGRLLGDRDHTTVMSGLRRASALLDTDDAFAAMVERLAAVREATRP